MIIIDDSQANSCTLLILLFNPIQDGLFRGCSRMGGTFSAPLLKIRHTYPTMIKLGTVIPYLMNIQKMHKSRDTSL